MAARGRGAARRQGCGFGVWVGVGVWVSGEQAHLGDERRAEVGEELHEVPSGEARLAIRRSDAAHAEEHRHGRRRIESEARAGHACHPTDQEGDPPIYGRGRMHALSTYDMEGHACHPTGRGAGPTWGR